MALRLGAVQDAFLEAGVSPGTAAKAAEEIAGYERQLADIRGDLTVLKWMVGATLGLVLLVLGKVWFP